MEMEACVTRERYRLILNPAAGKGTARNALPTIRSHLDKAGILYEIVETERPLHGIELAERAAKDGVDVVVAVGGDGTVNELINGLMNVRQAVDKLPSLGVLCVGRGNDFAFGAGIPSTVDGDCRTLIDGHRKTIDVAHVRGGLYPDGRYVGNGVGIGFDAVVGFVAKEFKRLSGFIGYFVAALKTIFLYFQAPKVRIEMDGETIEMSALMVSIMNGRRMGGGFHMAPNGDMGDGHLDLCMAQEVSRMGIFRLIPRFMKGTQASHPAIRTAQATRVQVEALDGSLPAHADGETLCTDGTQLSIEIHPAALQILTPGEGAQ